jgi:CheY-like chemotaxis protein
MTPPDFERAGGVNLLFTMRGVQSHLSEHRSYLRVAAKGSKSPMRQEATMMSVEYAGGAGAGRTPAFPTVLVVEDDSLVMDVLTEALADDQFRVLAATDAVTARKMLESDDVDVLFTDIDLGPGPNGLALARQARILKPDLAVVYASGGRGELATELAVPGSEFLPKPYRYSDVCDLVSRLVREASQAPIESRAT